MPGLTAFLDWMDAEGIRRVAVTNAPRENIEVMMEGLGIRSRFEKIVLGDECTRPKPFPDPYLEGLAYLGEEGGGLSLAWPVLYALTYVMQVEFVYIVCVGVAYRIVRSPARFPPPRHVRR